MRKEPGGASWLPPLLFQLCLCLSPGGRDSPLLLLGSSLDFVSDTLTHITGKCTLSSSCWRSLLASWLLSLGLTLQRPDTKPSEPRASRSTEVSPLEPAPRPAGPAPSLCLGQGSDDCSGSCSCRDTGQPEEHHSRMPRAPHCSCRGLYTGHSGGGS